MTNSTPEDAREIPPANPMLLVDRLVEDTVAELASKYLARNEIYDLYNIGPDTEVTSLKELLVEDPQLYAGISAAHALLSLDVHGIKRQIIAPLLINHVLFHRILENGKTIRHQGAATWRRANLDKIIESRPDLAPAGTVVSENWGESVGLVASVIGMSDQTTAILEDDKLGGETAMLLGDDGLDFLHKLEPIQSIESDEFATACDSVRAIRYLHTIKFCGLGYFNLVCRAPDQLLMATHNRGRQAIRFPILDPAVSLKDRLTSMMDFGEDVAVALGKLVDPDEAVLDLSASLIAISSYGRMEARILDAVIRGFKEDYAASNAEEETALADQPEPRPLGAVAVAETLPQPGTDEAPSFELDWKISAKKLDRELTSHKTILRQLIMGSEQLSIEGITKAEASDVMKVILNVVRLAQSCADEASVVAAAHQLSQDIQTYRLLAAQGAPPQNMPNIDRALQQANQRLMLVTANLIQDGHKPQISSETIRRVADIIDRAIISAT